MAGPLGVSHLLLFSRSTTGNTNLRLALTPRGPTLHFRVERYSLRKDIQKVIKHPKVTSKAYLTAPLLVMNNFTLPEQVDSSGPTVPKQLESLATAVFQSLFPPISPQSIPLSSVQRVLLLDRELPKPSSATSLSKESGYIVNLRHFAITTKSTGLSRGIRRLNAAEKLLKDRKRRLNLPNLGKLDDVAEYLLDPSAAAGGFTSGSESEVETDAEVEVMEPAKKKVMNRRQFEILQNGDGKPSRRGISNVEKRAIRLTEIGPRMRLRMTKVEEGVCNGKVMWHEYISKSVHEVKQMELVWESRRLQKEERRRVQKENVERRNRSNGITAKDNNNDNEDMDEYDWNSEDIENNMQMEHEEQ